MPVAELSFTIQSVKNIAAARESESEAVTQFLQTARAGPAGLLVEGEPGIGKTTVWSEAVDSAADAGFRVLSARASAAEARLTFAVVADLLAGIDPEIFDELAPVQRVALNRVLLRGDEGPATDERVAAAAFLSVLELLATQSPLLVAIDDLQWLDSPSRAVVSFAARRLTGAVAVLAAARTGEPNSPDTSWLRLPTPPQLTTLTLRPLSLGGLHTILATQLGHTLPRPVVTRIHDVSGGNPMYALELARTLDGHPDPTRLGLPDSLTELVQRRLGNISPPTTHVLLAAACSPNPTVTELAQATQADTASVLAELENGEEQGIVIIDGNRVRFTHPLLSHGIYTQASAPQRRAMHRNLAALATLPELRARHLALAAVDADKTTLHAIDTAADAAAARGAPSAAAELLDLAISLGGNNPTRRLRAAEQHFRAGSLAQADHLLQALIDTLEPGPLRAIALMLRGAVDGYGANFTRTVRMLSQAVAEAGDIPALRIQALMLLALAVSVTGDVEESINYARRAVADTEQLDNADLCSQALALWVHLTFISGSGTDEQALARALTLEDPNTTAPADCQASAVAAINCALTGNLHEARTRLATVSERCLSRGQEFEVVWAAQFATLVDVWLGHYDDAARIAEDALQRAEQIGGHLPMIEALSARATVAAYRGHQDQTRHAAHTAIEAAHADNIRVLGVIPAASLVFLEVSLGDYQAAVTALEPLLNAFNPEHGTEILLKGFLPDAIETLITLGRLNEAEPLITALQTNGTRLDRPWMLATGTRGRAMLHAAHGDLDTATTTAEHALHYHHRLPMPFERARTQLLLGQLHRRTRNKHAATQTLQQALHTFTTLGTPLWAARTHTELTHLHTTPTDGTDLTPSELRIAQRAAAGLTNRDIAAELFLSPKTVEMNLSRAYRKLGIRSRTQLHTRLKAENSRENPGSPDDIAH